MQKYEVIILPLAEKDIKSNTDYIFYEKEMPDVAAKLLNGFYKVIKGLAIMPEKYEIDEDEFLGALQIRKCYYKKYKIYFYVDKGENRVYVLRVLHMLLDTRNIVFIT